MCGTCGCNVTEDSAGLRVGTDGLRVVEVMQSLMGANDRAAARKRALHDLDLGALDILFIENVGNLGCPASYDLGHHANVTLLSTTEGEDKPPKYPVMFRAPDLMLVVKADLAPVLSGFDPALAGADLVFDEEACHIWWQAGLRETAPMRQVAEPVPDDA